MNKNKPIVLYTAAIYLGSALMCMCLNLTGALLPDIITDYHLELNSGGLVSFAQYLGGIIGILLISRVADRTRKPIVLIVGFALIGCILIAVGGFPPFIGFMLLYVVFGGILCVIDVMNNAVISDLHGDGRNIAFGLYHGISSVGAACISIVTVIIGAGNWNETYRTVAFVVFGIVILHLVTYILGKRDIDALIPIAEKKERQLSAGRFFRDGRNWVAAVSMFGFGICQSGVTVWCVKFCKEMFPEQTALAWALSLSAYWIGAMICRLSIGLIPFFQKMDSLKLVRWGGITAAAALFLGVISGNYYGVIIGIFAMGVLNGATLPRLVGLLTGWYPEYSGLASSLSFVALYAGYALVPLVMGAVASAWGMTIMMMIPVAGTLLSGVLGFLIKE